MYEKALDACATSPFARGVKRWILAGMDPSDANSLQQQPSSLSMLAEVAAAAPQCEPGPLLQS